ncbi:hypothetical protein Phum_PHUM586940 [Pediculus humanus corporis]|uniref:Uncharacterized protein n=1 Tax=Pediculus humanus subsp. corporis TaxID=121224 RepID=E0W290_PEDHC|nr:uncharacterized protein Phum_PHUM586940 [Pediculus humanus corporis]EEB19746.1 hypothetical protein Phum_PHUM586940 [Pediculus humanus corporis]
MIILIKINSGIVPPLGCVYVRVCVHTRASNFIPENFKQIPISFPVERFFANVSSGYLITLSLWCHKNIFFLFRSVDTTTFSRLFCL